MKKLINTARNLRWPCTILGIGAFVIRFLYGKSNDLNANGELELSTTGLLLTVGAVILLVVGLFSFGLYSASKKNN